MLQDELYGRQVISGHVQYRYLFPFKSSDIYLAARYDFGGVWSEPKLEIPAEDLFAGFGAFLGADTFLGPLYIGWGKASVGQKTLYLSLGYEF